MSEYLQSFLKCSHIKVVEPYVFAVTMPDTDGTTHEVVCSSSDVLMEPLLVRVNIISAFSADIHGAPNSAITRYGIHFCNESSAGAHGSRFDSKDIVYLRQSEFDLGWWKKLSEMMIAAALTIGHPRSYVDTFAEAVMRESTNSGVFQAVNPKEI